MKVVTVSAFNLSEYRSVSYIQILDNPYPTGLL